MSIFAWERLGAPVLVVGVAAAALLGGCSTPLQEANARAANDQVVELRVKTPFDVELARAALAPGTSRIVGTVFAEVNAPNNYNPGATAKVFKEGVDVVLFPVTPYLREYLDLQKSLSDKPGLFQRRRAPGQYRLVEDPNFLRYRRFESTDKYGRFAFQGLKPGEYHVALLFKHVFYSMQNVRVATVSGYYDTAGVYQAQEFSEPVEMVMSKSVRIDGDGDVEELSFSRRGTKNYRAPQ